MIKKQSDNDAVKARTLINRIFAEDYQKLVRYAYLALYGSAHGDVGRAEDVVQDAMIIALNSPEKFCASPNPTGWLIQAIRYTACNTIRSDRRMTILLREYFYLNDTVKQDAHDIDFLFSGVVDDDDLQLLKRHYVEGYSYQELRKALNLKHSAFSMRLQRAKAKFVKNYYLSSDKMDDTEHNKIGGVQNANES